MGTAETTRVALLIEDDGLIAFDLHDALVTAGYRVTGPLSRTADALALLQQETPSVAVVDVRLLDGSCAALARELRRRRVPFLVHSGCYRGDPLAAEFLDVPWLPKPTAAEDVVRVLTHLSRTRLEPCSA